MRKETVCRSSIGNHIKGFLEEKWSLGYKYMHEANIMRIFDEYCIKSLRHPFAPHN